MDARRNFPGGETFGGASKKSEGGPPYFLRQTLKYAYRGGGVGRVVLMPADFFSGGP